MRFIPTSTFRRICRRAAPLVLSVGLSIVVAFSLLQGADTDLRVVEAAKAGNRASLEILLKNHASVNAMETDGTTALHWAARADDVATVRLLVRAGANPKAANRYGVTPLSLAVTTGDPALVDALLSAGADANAVTQGGETVLMTAAHAGNAQIVQKLLVHGAEVDARENTYGENALIWAAAENHPEALKILIEHGANVNIRSNELKYPKDRFGLEAVYTILPHGYWTPLMYAARQGSLEAAKALVEAHAELNETDTDGTTPLVLAIINGHYDTAAMLAERGADPNIADTTGMAALYATVDMSTLGEIFGRPARKFPDKLTPVELMKVLLAHGADANARLKSPTLFRAHTPGESVLGEGATPLMRAARNGDAAAIRVLLDHGADPELIQKSGATALMLASGMGRNVSAFQNEYATDAAMLEAAQVLVARHVNLDVADKNGQTALHFASLSLDPVVKLLAEAGATLDAKDKQGRTPLDMAMGKGGRGRAGAAPTVRQSTVDLLQDLMNKKAAKLAPGAAVVAPGEAGPRKP